MGSLFSAPKMPAAAAAPAVISPVDTPAPTPTVAPPIIPTENSTAIIKAQQDQLAANAARSGRASTILSQNDISKSDTLG